MKKLIFIITFTLVCTSCSTSVSENTCIQIPEAEYRKTWSDQLYSFRWSLTGRKENTASDIFTNASNRPLSYFVHGEFYEICIDSNIIIEARRL